MPQPNIVLIVADDMGYGDFGAFNDGSSRTPQLDRLVGESLCLTQHYSASPVCAPARAGLLTGRYPHRTGAIDTLDARGLDRIALRETTIGDVFKAAGYATGCVGKWHSGAGDPRYHPNARGFDEFAGFRGGWWDYYYWTLDYNGSPKAADGRYLTDVFTEEAVAFIRRHRKEPFFLHLPYNAPHSPHQCPEEDVEPFARTGAFTSALCKVYGMIYRMDKGVGRVLEAIDAEGIANNTIVLFTSDNGPAFGGEGDGCINRFNCGFNGCKGNVYEGGIRLPMVIRWPDGLQAGTQSDQMVHFTDWLPTLAAAAGIEVPGELELDGWNVLPALQGDAGKVNTRRFWQWNRYTPVAECNAAMRDGAWKLVRPAIAEAMWVSKADGEIDVATKYKPESRPPVCQDPEPERQIPPPPPAQLYNIDRDPLEQEDLAAAEPQRAAKMLSELEEWFEAVEAERRTINDVW